MINFYEHIDAFIEGTLDSITRSQMEEAISRNEEYQSAVEHYPTAKKLSEALLEIDILEKIKSLETPDKIIDISDTNEIPSSSINWVQYLIGLGLVALAYFSYSYFTKVNNQTLKQEELFAKLYVAPLDPDAVRSVSIDDLEPFKAGKHYFALNDFDNALEALKQAENDITSESTQDLEKLSQIYYWMGHAYLNKKEWNQARSAFLKSSERDSQKNLDLIQSILKN